MKRTTPMTKKEVIAKCRAQRVPVKNYGGDSLLVGTPGRGYVIYNQFTGFFFGVSHTGVSFSSQAGQHGRLAWMKKLHAFFERDVR